MFNNNKNRIRAGLIIIILSYACTPVAIGLAFKKYLMVAIILYIIGWIGLALGTFMTGKEAYKKFKERLKIW